MNNIPIEILCATSKDHVVKEPIMLDCEDFICKTCIPVGYGSNRIVCGHCGIENHSDLKTKSRSKSGVSLLNENIDILFENMFQEFKTNLKKLKSKTIMNTRIKTFKDELDQRNKFLKEQIDRQTRRLKSTLDSVESTMNNLVNENELEQYQFKLDKLEYLLKNNLKNVNDLYEYNDEIRKLKEVIDVANKVKLNISDTNLDSSIVGSINMAEIDECLQNHPSYSNMNDLNIIRPWGVTDNDVEPVKPIFTRQNYTNKEEFSIEFKCKLARFGQMEEFESDVTSINERTIRLATESEDKDNFLQTTIAKKDIFYCGVYFSYDYLIFFIKLNTNLVFEKFKKQFDTTSEIGKLNRIILICDGSIVSKASKWQRFYEVIKKYGSRFDCLTFEKTRELLIDSLGHNLASKGIINFGKFKIEATNKLTEGDIQCLNENQMLNNKVIDSYLTYLEEKVINDNDRKRILILKSEFHATLLKQHDFRDLQNLKRFKNDQDLFEKDLIIIPIRNMIHWSLILVCFPSNAIKRDDDIENAVEQRALIVSLDPLNIDHSGTMFTLIKYLQHEWYEKDIKNASFNKTKFKTITADVPQERNVFDSGVFTLAYVEHLLEKDLKFLQPTLDSYKCGLYLFNENKMRKEIRNTCKQMANICDDIMEITPIPIAKRLRRSLQ